MSKKREFRVSKSVDLERFSKTSKISLEHMVSKNRQQQNDLEK